MKTRTAVLPDNPFLQAPRSPARVRAFSPGPAQNRHAGSVTAAPGEPADLVELQDVQTEHGPILVGFDRDSGTYVAEHGDFSHPQRGRTESGSVATLIRILEERQKRAGGDLGI